MKAEGVIKKLYKELRREYGKPLGQWKLWCKRPKTEKEREEVIIGAILTQRTNWKNVELALNNLKGAREDSLKDIYQLGFKKLAPLIRPAGFYKTKARYLFNLAKFIVENYGGLEKMKKSELKELREELLELKGIGPETADSILLYALDKPIFVIDEYTRRLARARNLPGETDYHSLQKLFRESLRRDYGLYQDFHALIVINGKKYGNKNKKFK